MPVGAATREIDFVDHELATPAEHHPKLLAKTPK
jgi:hypothetical protein